MYGPVAETPAASKNGDRPAFEPLAPTYCFMLATTSFAVIVEPSWNLTPLRIWNVHTVASAFGFQLVASAGTTWPFGVVNVRNSPGMPANASDPPSFRRYGSRRGTEGAAMPTRIVPPALAPSRRASRTVAAAASPANASRLPIMPTESPNIVPRRKNSLRSISPPMNSSIRLFSSGPASLRRKSSIRLVVSRSIAYSLTFRFDIDLDGHVDACTDPKLEVLLVDPDASRSIGALPFRRTSLL